MIFVIKLILLQTTHILQHLTYIFSKYTQHFIKIHTNITIFDTFGKKVPQWDLRISLIELLPFGISNSLTCGPQRSCKCQRKKWRKKSGLEAKSFTRSCEQALQDHC